jgi:hypothetical protein
MAVDSGAPRRRGRLARLVARVRRSKLAAFVSGCLLGGSLALLHGSPGALIASLFVWIVLWTQTPRELAGAARRAVKRVRGRPRDERYWTTLVPGYLPPLLGVGAQSLWPAFGAQISLSFYATLAQIIPVLVLAGFVEIASLRAITNTSDDRAVVRLLVFGLGLGALAGETGALYAVGADTTSTFLLVTAATAVLIQMLLLVMLVAFRD